MQFTSVNEYCLSTMFSASPHGFLTSVCDEYAAVPYPPIVIVTSPFPSRSAISWADLSLM